MVAYTAAGESGPHDAVPLPLTNQPLAVPELAAQVGAFEGSLEIPVPLPPDALPLSTVRLELSRSVAGDLLTGLEFLTGYPYGCVEQTMSRALPNAAVSRAFELLGAGQPGRKEALAPLINAGLQRLYGYQHDDGGWGWWYDDATHDYQTAWVVFGLAITTQAGYEVEPRVIERGAQWLAGHLDEMDPRTRAYALYSLAVAGRGDLAAVEALERDALPGLDAFSQAALALAYHALGAGERANTLLDLLAASAVTSSGQAYWPQAAEDGRYHQKTLASTTRATAFALDAFVQIDPQHALVPGAAQWLMGQRKRSGWGSTNETAYAILALSDHLLAVRESLGPAALAVEINGTLLLTATLDAQQPLLSLEIPFERWVPGANSLRLAQTSGSGPVYYRLIQRVYLPEAEIPAAGEIEIRRAYLDPKTKNRIHSAALGQLVLVRLWVTVPKGGFYMILEDQLPGGLEALNEGLNNASHERAFTGDAFAEIFHWMEYGYNYKEIRGSRVSFFITEMAAGKFSFTYLARATRPGEFAALPAQAYGMYDEALWGRSASGPFVITMLPAGSPPPLVEPPDEE
jgi:hypothetical protein